VQIEALTALEVLSLPRRVLIIAFPLGTVSAGNSPTGEIHVVEVITAGKGLLHSLKPLAMWIPA